MQKTLQVLVLVCLAGCVGTGIGVLLFENFGGLQQRVLWSALAGVVFGLTALGSTISVSQRWLGPLRPVGLATSGAALALSLALVWDVFADGFAVWKAAATAIVVAVTAFHVALLGTFTPRRTVVWAWRSAAMLIAIGAAFLVVGALWGQVGSGENSMYYGWLAVAVFLDVAATLGLYPLSRQTGAGGRKLLGKRPVTAGGSEGRGTNRGGFGVTR